MKIMSLIYKIVIIKLIAGVNIENIKKGNIELFKSFRFLSIKTLKQIGDV